MGDSNIIPVNGTIALFISIDAARIERNDGKVKMLTPMIWTQHVARVQIWAENWWIGVR